jgi:hypothetical protein
VSADDYNVREWFADRLGGEHVTAMTRIAQRQLGLAVDGKCGPRTRAALEAQSAPVPTGPRTPPDLTTIPGLLAAYPAIPPTAAAAVSIALGLRGRGEVGGNNKGPFIRELGGHDGYLWCALFASYPWREAHRRAGIPTPLWAYRRPGVVEAGARALALQAAAEGRRFHDPAEALPGDIVLWQRTGGHHVGLVWHPAGNGVTVTIEGNVGAFPAVVRELTHDTRHEPHFECFARPWRGL